MNFLTEWNRMYDFCMSKKLSKSEILLLHALYMINNKNDWDVWFEADNLHVQRLTGGLSRQSIVEARNKLKQKGRIEFREGKKNQQSPFYRIIPFFSKMDIQVDIQGDKEVDILLDIQGDLLDKLNQTKPNKKKKAHAPAKFTPPTLEEIQAYCLERKNSVDPKRFFDYFDASNWIDSEGKPVRNWKQKIITWEGGRKGGNQQKPAQPANPTYTKSDFLDGG